jgi:hypothetical protein
MVVVVDVVEDDPAVDDVVAWCAGGEVVAGGEELQAASTRPQRSRIGPATFALAYDCGVAAPCTRSVWRGRAVGGGRI